MIHKPLADLVALLRISPKQPQTRNNGPDRHRIPYLNDEHKPIAGNCLVWRIELENPSATIRYSNHSLQGNMDNLQQIYHLPPLLYRHISIGSWSQSYAEGARMLQDELSSFNCTLPFEVKFQVLKLLHNNYLNPSTLLDLLPEITSIAERSPVAIAAATVRRLCTQLDFPGPHVITESFQVDSLVNMLKENENRIQRQGILLNDIGGEAISDNMAMIHRVKITPAGFCLFGPERETQNRVLRKYPDHHRNFLRVEFGDEDGLPIRFNAKICNDRIFSTVQDEETKLYTGRFKALLESGIEIADMRYNFLGYSHSSLRSKMCWLVAPFLFHDDLMSNTNIIHDLGDFTVFTVPAKCAARIGQTFSDTPTSVPINPIVVRIGKDIERNGRVFSDGVGTMSQSLLDRLRDKYCQSRVKR